MRKASTMDRTERLRKVYHLLGGLITPALYLFILEKRTMLLIAGSLLAVVLLFEAARLRIAGFRRWIRVVVPVQFKAREETRLAGQAFMQIGYFITILCFPRSVAVLAMIFLAVGDPIAAMAGKSFGRHRIPGTVKSIEGSIGCFAACAATGYLIGCLWLGFPLWLVLAGAATGTLLEVFNFGLDDNLLIPIATGLVMHLLALS